MNAGNEYLTYKKIIRVYIKYSECICPMSLNINPSLPMPFLDLIFKTICHHLMWLHNELFSVVDDKPIMQFKQITTSHILFLKHRERYDNQMCDDWNKWNHSGVAVSLEVKTFLFSCYIPDLFTVEKICELWFNNTHKQPFPPCVLYYHYNITFKVLNK